MAEETRSEWMTAAPTTGGDFEILEAGAYDAVCVGLTRKNFKKYKSENEFEPKFQFIFQIVDGETKHYLRTLPMRNVINDKSNLFMFLNSWLGVSLEKCAEGIDLGKTVGLKGQVVVGESERGDKKYNTIENVLKAKKSSTVKFVPDDQAPAFLTKDLLGAHWIDGLAFAEAEENNAEITDDDLVKAADEKKASATKKVDGKEFLNKKAEATEDDDAGLPF